jgi:thiamine pyrophosphate-dependent acetolactate synthase large subunit-like protein
VLADLIPSYIALCFSMAQISSSTTEASSQSSAVHNDGNSTIIERTIKKTIDGIQTLLNPLNNMTPEEEEMEEKMAVIKISEATQKHFNLQTKTLQDAPRDPDKLRELLKEKLKEYETAEDSEVIEDLATEIEMLKYVLFLVNRNSTPS